MTTPLDPRTLRAISRRLQERETNLLRSRIAKLETEELRQRRKAQQFMACADALEQVANGEEIRCVVSERPGIYECRSESLCSGCRVRTRIAKLEAVAEAQAKVIAAYDKWPGDVHAAKAELERVKDK